jgi:hypothetical protein
MTESLICLHPGKRFREPSVPQVSDRGCVAAPFAAAGRGDREDPAGEAASPYCDRLVGVAGDERPLEQFCGSCGGAPVRSRVRGCASRPKRPGTTQRPALFSVPFLPSTATATIPAPSGPPAWAAGLLGQPRSDRGVHRAGVDVGQYPPQRRLRRAPSGGGVEPGQQPGGHVCDPAGDRGERAHPGQHRRRAQRQHHPDRVIPTLIRASVRDRGEPLQQASVPDSARRQVTPAFRIGLADGQSRRAGLGDGRMGWQRSSGGVRSWEGPLLLPELRSPTRRDTPKITDLRAQRHLPRPQTAIMILERPWWDRGGARTAA